MNSGDAENDYLRIAHIVDAHSLNGRLKIAVTSDNPERFNVGNTVYIERENSQSEYKITEFKPVKGRVALLGLNGILDRTAAEVLKGANIFIAKKEAERTREQLADDSFYYYDIIGCDIFMNGKKFAVVTDIMEAGSGNILVIRTNGGKSFLIPFVASMVDTSNIANRRIDISPVEGLFDI